MEAVREEKCSASNTSSGVDMPGACAIMAGTGTSLCSLLVNAIIREMLFDTFFNECMVFMGSILVLFTCFLYALLFQGFDCAL